MGRLLLVGIAEIAPWLRRKNSYVLAWLGLACKARPLHALVIQSQTMRTERRMAMQAVYG